MKLLFKKVSNERDVAVVAQLAKVIWHEHYTSIIGEPQVNFMVEKFQSEESILRQISESEYQYYLICSENLEIGYIGYVINGNDLFLSKLYVLKSARGMGSGKQAIQFLVEQALVFRAQTITLTVNKYNTGSIMAYERMGFEKIDSVVSDIGNGFVMDDFIMQLKIS